MHNSVAVGAAYYPLTSSIKIETSADGVLNWVPVYEGVAESGILRENSKMFVYPFSNVNNNFSLCTGDNELPAIKSPYSLSNMPDYILSLPDNDDYFNIRNNRLQLNHRELMEHLADKSPEYYYSDILIPSGKTLADFYKEVSL